MSAEHAQDHIARLEARCASLQSTLEEREREVAELRTQQETFELVCSATPDYVTIINRERRFLWTNRTHPSLTTEQVLQSRLDDFVDGEGLALVAAAIDEAFRTRALTRYVAPYRVGDDVGWVDTRCVYLPSRDAMLLVGSDVTEQTLAEQALQRSLGELSVTRERLEAAQRTAQLGHWEWSVQSTEVYWSPQMYALFGVDPEAFQPSYQGYLDLLPEPEREVAARVVQSALRHGEPYEIEHRISSAGREQRILLCHGEAVRDGDGAVLMLRGSAQDVTLMRRMEQELRATLAQQTLLLKEVHHRVKNNLQIVASLLALQALELKDPGARSALESCRDRVRTIALIHDELHQRERFATVPFRRLLRALTSQLAETFGRPDAHRVDLDGVDDLEMPLDQGIPCGLIVNELVTNAFKHAFPGDRRGTLRVGLRTGGDGRIVLSVGDDGVGFDAEHFRESGSLGLRIVSTLADQLGGTLAIDAGTRGAEVSVSFPPAADG